MGQPLPQTETPDETSTPSGTPRRLQLTRTQRYGGFVIAAGLALYALLGIVKYRIILKDGPVLPDRDSLTVQEGRLLSARRAGGKTKRRHLLIELEGAPNAFIYDPKAGAIDAVEKALSGKTGTLTVLYDPPNATVYEIRRHGAPIRSYEQTAEGYKKSLVDQAHVRGMLAFVLLLGTIVLTIALARMKPSTAPPRTEAMPNYLNKPFDLTDENLASAYDEVPFWSFPFGEAILANIPLKPGITALDIGFGTGFPLLELSQRLGKTSTVYGIDLWRAAQPRAAFKAKTLGIDNIVLVEGDAASMPFEAATFDLIVSSVGINNFEHPEQVFAECRRVAKSGAQLAFSTNPRGHMGELYRAFGETLTAQGLSDALPALDTHEGRRLSAQEIGAMLEAAGLTVSRTIETRFVWRFADGSAFLNHHVVKRAFVGGWQRIVPTEHHETFFEALEARLNTEAKEKGVFAVTVPVVYIEATKAS